MVDDISEIVLPNRFSIIMRAGLSFNFEAKWRQSRILKERRLKSDMKLD